MLALTRRRKMNKAKRLRKWLRTKLKVASSEGTRYWITRLGRKQDQQYHELRNEVDQLRQKLQATGDDLLLEIMKTREGDF